MKFVRDYIVFLLRAWRLSFTGNAAYYAWMTVLTILAVIGGNAYVRQLVEGMATTGLTDEVSWGAYIANFTFLVGVAVASVMVVIPAYVYRIKAMREVVLFGELLAIAAILMSLLFVTVDLGRPDRFWHMIPGIGKFNFPDSLLAWDVIALTGFLLLNLHICGYLLYVKYRGQDATRLFYVPFVFISIVWAISVLAVEAFLYAGLVGRPFWNSAIVAPRFLMSAFVSGPAIVILVLQVIRRVTAYAVKDEAIHVLRRIMTVSLLVNMFLLAAEMFTEFYSGALHNAGARYLFFGLEHNGQMNNMLVPWIWSAIALEIVAVLILLTAAGRRISLLNVACIASVIGIWIEKGMGLLIPGFVPTPLGDVQEYLPSINETLICIGIWALGALVYSWSLHLAVPILTGRFRKEQEGAIDSDKHTQGAEGYGAVSAEGT